MIFAEAIEKYQLKVQKEAKRRKGDSSSIITAGTTGNNARDYKGSVLI